MTPEKCPHCGAESLETGTTNVTRLNTDNPLLAEQVKVVIARTYRCGTRATGCVDQCALDNCAGSVVYNNQMQS